MHYCGVIASAKDLANIHQAHTGHFASQIHGDLTRNSHVFGSRFTDKILKRQVEVFATWLMMSVGLISTSVVKKSCNVCSAKARVTG